MVTFKQEVQDKHGKVVQRTYSNEPSATYRWAVVRPVDGGQRTAIVWGKTRTQAFEYAHYTGLNNATWAVARLQRLEGKPA
jgi:hypothetical protein